jgi:hypothetical protein
MVFTIIFSSCTLKKTYAKRTDENPGHEFVCQLNTSLIKNLVEVDFSAVYLISLHLQIYIDYDAVVKNE